MTKKQGPPDPARLADMTMHPEPDGEFLLPPPEELEEWKLDPFDLESGGQLRGRFVIWVPRNKVVEFSISQVMKVDGTWQQITRIDTCHSRVHRHQFGWRQPNVDIVEQEVLAVIPLDGWDVVDSCYDEALALMHTEWQNYYERWKGDGK